MDPEIVRGRRDEIAASLLELPSLSIAIAIEHLAELYVNHRRRGSEWERAVSVELLYPPGERFRYLRGFQIDCGFRMQGGLATDQARKKSFRLLFKRKYGWRRLVGKQRCGTES